MTIIDAAGWLGLIFNVVGNVWLTGRGPEGWLVRLAVNLFFVPYCINQHAWALLVNHVVFIPINLLGWWRWKPARPDALANEVKRLRKELYDIETACRRARMD